MTRAAAWSVPVVAASTAAPAFAASPCGITATSTLDWGNTAIYNTTTHAFTVTPSGQTAVTGTVTSVFTNYTAAAGNLGTTASIGGTSSTGLNLLQNANAATDSNNPAKNQTVTIHFSRPVFNLSFLVTDIDASTANPATYTDAVAIFASNNGTTVTVARSTPSGSTVTGSGTSTASPATNNASYSNSQNGGNALFTISGTITDITYQYWNSLAGTNGTQYSYIAPITFSSKPAGC